MGTRKRISPIDWIIMLLVSAIAAEEAAYVAQYDLLAPVRDIAVLAAAALILLTVKAVYLLWTCRQVGARR